MTGDVAHKSIGEDGFLLIFSWGHQCHRLSLGYTRGLEASLRESKAWRRAAMIIPDKFLTVVEAGIPHLSSRKSKPRTLTKTLAIRHQFPSVKVEAPRTAQRVSHIDQCNHNERRKC